MPSRMHVIHRVVLWWTVTVAGCASQAALDSPGDPGAAPFSKLVELYYAARFGDADVPRGDLDRLAHEVARPQPPQT